MRSWTSFPRIKPCIHTYSIVQNMEGANSGGPWHIINIYIKVGPMYWKTTKGGAVRGIQPRSFKGAGTGHPLVSVRHGTHTFSARCKFPLIPPDSAHAVTTATKSQVRLPAGCHRLARSAPGTETKARCYSQSLQPSQFWRSSLGVRVMAGVFFFRAEIRSDCEKWKLGDKKFRRYEVKEN